MSFQVHYILRSQQDGKYLAAHPDGSQGSGYLLMFREDFEARSFINTHGADMASRFAVEAVPETQLKNLLKLWDFTGIGLVVDPLIPKVEFLSQDG
ncbi:MAG: hypothetical protein GDA48_27025 [Hormoscilla sp. GM102CHS1]|nr:hypothetical protein [Hormoscilla sp. GM102CHS1]